MKSLLIPLCLSILALSPLSAQSQGDDEYVRIELLGAANGSANVRSSYDVTATTAGATTTTRSSG